MKYVIAGNYEQFIDYCHENRLAPGTDALFLDSHRGFVGMHFPVSDLVKVGSWRERKDIGGIRAMLYRCVWPATKYDPLFETVLRSPLFEPPVPRQSRILSHQERWAGWEK